MYGHATAKLVTFLSRSQKERNVEGRRARSGQEVTFQGKDPVVVVVKLDVVGSKRGRKKVCWKSTPKVSTMMTTPNL